MLACRYPASLARIKLVTTCRYERLDGYALLMSGVDEETVDTEEDIIGTAKIGRESGRRMREKTFL